MKEIGKMYMTEATMKSKECSKIDDTTYITEHAYCNYLYTNVRKLSQAELDELQFTCQQFEAYAFEYTKAEWEAGQYATMLQNKESIAQATETIDGINNTHKKKYQR